MTKEQLWEQQERTWNDNNVFVTTETAWLAGYETRDRMTCEWRWKEQPSSNEEGWGTRCQKFLWDGDKPKFCPNCGGRVKEAK